jgi:hypothetical protein
MELGIQTHLGENMKYGNTDNATKTRQLKNKFKETMKFMIEQLISEDHTRDDTDHHMSIRRLTGQSIETTDDREFTQDEVRWIIEGFNPRRAPGPDGITAEILTLIFKSIPKTVTSVYNDC